MKNSESSECGMRNAECGNKRPFVIPPSLFCLLTSLILCLFVWPSFLWCQDDIKDPGPGMTASLDRDSAKVGSIVELTLTYCLPEGAGFAAHPEIKGLEDFTEVDRRLGPDRITIKLLVDRLGSWKTGPLSLSYLDKEGKTRTLATDPVSLIVLSNLGEKPEEARLKPIQGIVPTRPPWLKYLPWAAGMLGLLLIVLVLVWWYRKGRGKRRSIMAVDLPHIRARKEFEELEAAGLFEKGQVKAFYFRFSEILRRYLESLRGFPAAEFTTEEIVIHIDREHDRKLIPLLRQADLIKFADSMPTPVKKGEDVRTALTYIQETSPAPETVHTADGSGETAR